MEDELASYLAAVERDGRYTVDAVLKESPAEVTQRVSLVSSAGTRNSFIRKYIARDAGIGGAYERIYAAQQQGAALAGVPRMEACQAIGEQLVVIMEYVQGQTLAEVVRQRGGSLALAANVFPALCDAVVSLHECFEPPLIHRDLKPENIMVGEDGSVALIDFGIARTVSEGARSDTTHLGTRGYAPPEQFGFAATDERSDIYSLDWVLWFCLTGEEPDAAGGQQGFETSGVPAELREVVAQATAFDPKDRYASVREMRDAFLQVTREIREPGSASAFPPPKGPAVSIPGVPSPSSPGNASDVVAAASPLTTLRLSVRAFRARIPHGVIVAWNACVLIVFAVFFVACVSLAANPIQEPYAQHPLWARILEYPIMCGSLFAAIAYALLDKRRLRARFAALRRFRWWQEALIVGGVVLLIMIVVTALVSGP